MANGDVARAAGLAVFSRNQDVNQGAENDNTRGDELGALLLRIRIQQAEPEDPFEGMLWISW